MKRGLPILIISNEGISFPPPPFLKGFFLVPWNLVHNIELKLTHVKYYRMPIVDNILVLVVNFSHPVINTPHPIEVSHRITK